MQRTIGAKLHKRKVTATALLEKPAILLLQFLQLVAAAAVFSLDMAAPNSNSYPALYEPHFKMTTSSTPLLAWTEARTSNFAQNPTRGSKWPPLHRKNYSTPKSNWNLAAQLMAQMARRKAVVAGQQHFYQRNSWNHITNWKKTPPPPNSTHIYD